MGRENVIGENERRREKKRREKERDVPGARNQAASGQADMRSRKAGHAERRKGKKVLRQNVDKEKQVKIRSKIRSSVYN